MVIMVKISVFKYYISNNSTITEPTLYITKISQVSINSALYLNNLKIENNGIMGNTSLAVPGALPCHLQCLPPATPRPTYTPEI